ENHHRKALEEGAGRGRAPQIRSREGAGEGVVAEARNEKGPGAIAPGPSYESGYTGRSLLDQPFGLQRLLHLRALGDALVISLHVRPLAEVDLLEVGPVGDGEEIGVGDGELVANQVLVVGEVLVQQRVAPRQVLLRDGL